MEESNSCLDMNDVPLQQTLCEFWKLVVSRHEIVLDTLETCDSIPSGPCSPSPRPADSRAEMPCGDGCLLAGAGGLRVIDRMSDSASRAQIHQRSGIVCAGMAADPSTKSAVETCKDMLQF